MKKDALRRVIHPAAGVGSYKRVHFLAAEAIGDWDGHTPW